MDEDLRRLTARAQGHLNAPTASSQLTLVGTKTLGHGTVSLQPTILITCYTKECKRLIERQFKEGQSPIYLAQASLPTLVRLKKNRAWWAADSDQLEPRSVPAISTGQTTSTVSMEVFAMGSSPCGRMIKYQYFLEDRKRWVRRFSRIGGIIELEGRFFALTTAHALVLPETELSIRGSNAWEPEAESTTNAAEADSTSTDTEDADVSDSDAAGRDAIVPNLTPTAHFEDVDSSIFWSFNGQCSSSLQAGNETVSSTNNLGQDWALIQISDSLISTATNTYYPEGRTKPSIKISEIMSDVVWNGALSGLVSVLVSSTTPVQGHLYPNIVTMYAHGSAYRLRQVRLLKSNSTPLAMSGSWVVKGGQLLGTVVMADGDMDSVYVISAWSTLNHVRQLFAADHVGLPDMTTSSKQGAETDWPTGKATMIGGMYPLSDAASDWRPTSVMPPGAMNHFNQPWTLDEQVSLLVNVVQSSGIDVRSWLLRQMESSNIRPRWDEVALPTGRTLNGSRAMYESLQMQSSGFSLYKSLDLSGARRGTNVSTWSDSGLGSEYLPPPIPMQPRPPRSSDSPIPPTTNGEAFRILRRFNPPEPPRSSDTPIPPTTNGEAFSILRPFIPREPFGLPRRKRGRPTKEEAEERDRRLAESGQTYEPEKGPTKKSRLSETPWPLSEALATTSHTKPPPLFQEVESREPSSSEKRRSRRLVETTSGQSRSPPAGSGLDIDEDSAQSPSDRLLPRPERSEAVAAVSLDIQRGQDFQPEAERGGIEKE